jgi:hypothetical protein
LKTLGKWAGGQPGTTWDNLFFEVVPPLCVDLQGFMKRWDGWYNLFVSLACEGKEKCVAIIYRRSWQKVVPSVSPACKSFIAIGLRWDNLVFEVVPGCPTAGAGRVR